MLLAKGGGASATAKEPSEALALYDRTVLQPKVVVTLVPTICYSNGGDVLVSLEDQFLITKDGAEWQTASVAMGLHV